MGYSGRGCRPRAHEQAHRRIAVALQLQGRPASQGDDERQRRAKRCGRPWHWHSQHPHHSHGQGAARPKKDLTRRCYWVEHSPPSAPTVLCSPPTPPGATHGTLGARRLLAAVSSFARQRPGGTAERREYRSVRAGLGNVRRTGRRAGCEALGTLAQTGSGRWRA